MEFTLETHPDWYMPVEDMNTLILGTYPPYEEQRDFKFYYPNNLNHFWKILAHINGVPLKEWKNEAAIEERKLLMKKLRVGVQNLGLRIERKGTSSADKDLRLIEYQDIEQIVNESSSLKKILLTGYSRPESTYLWFIRYLTFRKIIYETPKPIKAGVEFIVHFSKPITCIIGNSTSTMAQKGGETFELLVQQFRKALE
jgi:G:T/U-mismatch repair DNA glycosylase